MLTRIEWPTLALLLITYGLYVTLVFITPDISLVLSALFLIPILTLHGSLQHELIHGHPTRITWLNTLLGFAPIGLFFPYSRFKETHLDHHRDHLLTDPALDAESNYLFKEDWDRLSPVMRSIRIFNNTLCGRLLLGPALGLISFIKTDLKVALKGRVSVLFHWCLHFTLIAGLLLALDLYTDFPAWLYLLCAYFANSILRIRTFLEHQAHDDPNARTVIIADTGPLAFLFLYNNLHVVHHTHPGEPWYRLSALYSKNEFYYRDRNRGYFYASYGEVFARYFMTSKDPVAHPMANNRDPQYKPYARGTWIPDVGETDTAQTCLECDQFLKRQQH